MDETIKHDSAVTFARDENCYTSGTAIPDDVTDATVEEY